MFEDNTILKIFPSLLGYKEVALARTSEVETTVSLINV